MARSAFELLAQRGDRALLLMYRNRQLSDSWMGLTHLLATLSEENGWAPERIRFRSPHLHPNGTMSFRFSYAGGRGGARYYSAFQEGDFGQFLANTNAAVVEFLVRCRTWRVGFDAVHTCLDNYCFERKRRIEDLCVATGRAVPGRAWFRIFETPEQKLEAGRWHARHGAAEAA